MTGDEVFQIEPNKDRPRMSGSSKLLMGLGIGCFSVCLIFCIGGVLLISYLRKMGSEEPAVIREQTERITKIDIPEAFDPAHSINAKFPLVGHVMSVVFYETKDRRGRMYLAQFNEQLTDNANREEWVKQVEEALEKAGQDQQSVNVEHTEELEVTIRGEPCTFYLGRGKGVKTKDEVWQVSGSFPGNEGPALISFTATTSDLDRDDIVSLIQSIK